MKIVTANNTRNPIWSDNYSNLISFVSQWFCYLTEVHMTIYTRNLKMSMWPWNFSILRVPLFKASKLWRIIEESLKRVNRLVGASIQWMISPSAVWVITEYEQCLLICVIMNEFAVIFQWPTSPRSRTVSCGLTALWWWGKPVIQPRI